MKLYEFQGKRLLKKFGIPVPEGMLLTRADERPCFGPPAVLKAQVLVGGRGKAGGIKMWKAEDELGGLLNSIFSLNIRGETVRAVLAEEKVDILQELYLSITIKGGTATPVIIASPAGGMDIEKVAHDEPDKIITMAVNPLVGIQDYQVRYLAKRLGQADVKALKKLLEGVYALFKGCDATLVEINPLAVTPNGLMALDAKVVLDDKAQRRKHLLLEMQQEHDSIVPPDKDQLKSDTITFVPLSGDIGLISDGAGTGMLTLDLIKDAGGEAANFCEMGGFTSPQVMYDAMCTVLRNPGIKSLLVVLIGGFNRMDEMAEGIIRYKEEHGLDVPCVIRMCGTMEKVGIEMMRQAGVPTEDSLVEAVAKAVALAEGR